MKSRYVSALREAERDALTAVQDKSKLLKEMAPSVQGSGLVGHQPTVEVLATGFFHETVAINLCSLCPMTHDHEVLATGLDSGMLVPLLTEPYGYYRHEVQAALLGRRHVGRDAMTAFAKAHYCPDHKMGLCRHCGQKMVHPFKANQEIYGIARGHLVGGMAELTPQVSMPAMDSLTPGSGGRPRKKAIEQAAAAMTLERARLLRATPQLRLGYSAPAVNDAATALGISCPTDMHPAKYLEVVDRHRGELARIAVGADDDLTAAVAQINGEIADLDSTRGRMSQALVSPSTGRLATTALGSIVGASVAQGIGAICGAVAGVIAPQTTRHLADHTLAKCSGVSLPAVRTWRIRRDIASRR